MKNYLLGAVALSFFLLGVDAVGIVAIPDLFETVLKWVLALSLFLGAGIYGQPFIRRLFGR